jgi:hypothetical protein
MRDASLLPVLIASLLDLDLFAELEPCGRKNGLAA